MSARVQIRRGSAAQWSEANPLLADGEPGLDTDADRLKIGDGVTPWSGLPWITQAPVPATGGWAAQRTVQVALPITTWTTNVAVVLNGCPIGAKVAATGIAVLSATANLTGYAALSFALPPTDSVQGFAAANRPLDVPINGLFTTAMPNQTLVLGSYGEVAANMLVGSRILAWRVG